MPDNSELRFDGRVAIVTGAGGGIGREHALLLAARGAAIVVNDVGSTVDGSGSSTGPAQLVVDEIVAAGGTAVADGNTVATAEGGEAVVQTAIDAFQSVDIVVNNAGVLRDKFFHNMTEDLVRTVLDVHLLGAFFVTRPAWIRMRERKYGRIVNTTSTAGLVGNPGQANYGAAKMGLVGLTRVLAAEGERYDIKVNAVAPLARSRMTEAVMGRLLEDIDPAFVASVAAVFAHESCPVSGRVYSVGGGRVSRFFVGMTSGWYDRAAALEPEAVLAHLDAIEDTSDYSIPDAAIEEIRSLRQLIRDTEQSAN